MNCVDIFVNDTLVYRQIVTELSSLMHFNFVYKVDAGDVIRAAGFVYTVPTTGIYSITVSASFSDTHISAYKLQGPDMPQANIGGKLIGLDKIQQLKEKPCGKILYADIP